MNPSATAYRHRHSDHAPERITLVTPIGRTCLAGAGCTEPAELGKRVCWMHTDEALIRTMTRGNAARVTETPDQRMRRLTRELLAIAWKVRARMALERAATVAVGEDAQ